MPVKNRFRLLAIGMLCALVPLLFSSLPFATGNAPSGASPAGEAAGDIPADPLTVLVLHSYHKGFRWTDSEEKGIRDTLEAELPDIRVITEYMDSKRHMEPEHLENLLRLFGTKYCSTPPDLVIATDDNAFTFLQLYGRQIFDNTPFVFCGVNRFQPEKLAGMCPVTGVVETIDLRDTLAIALAMHPDTRNVAVVVDRTPTGRSTAKYLEELLPDFRDRVEFQVLDNLTMAGLRQRLKNLPPKSLVLLLNFNRDSAGKMFSHVETIRLLRKATDLPIYSVWDFFVGEGIVGGMITDGRSQGAAAARLALRILGGENAADVPVVTESPKQWMFDYRELRRLGLSEDALPEGSVVMNRPKSFYEVNKKLIWSLVGALLFMSGVTAVMALNIIQRRRAQAELRDTAEKLSALLDSLPIVPFTAAIDPLGCFSYVSHNVIGITGFEPKDFLDDPEFWVHRIHPDDFGRVLERLEEGVPEGERLIYRFQTASGDYRWFSDTRRPVRYPEPGIPRAAGFWQDITTEVELKHEAERRLQQVIQADKLASLGELVAGVAHEILNPNVFISTNVPLLRETWEMLRPVVQRAETTGGNGLDVQELSNDMNEMLDDIMAGSERIDRVVRELREFASSTEHSQVQPVQLNEVVKKAFTLVGAQVRRTFASFELALDPELPLVEGDPTKLEQVVANLVVNATHAVRPGVKGALKISTRLLPQQRAVVLQVEDNGKGIAPELRERIFEPFFTTRREQGGTGLGLSVSYRLVRDHNGAIFLASRQGLGTVFTLALPCNPEQRLNMRPSLLWLDRDPVRLQHVEDIVRNQPEPHVLGLRDPGNMATILADNPQVVAVCLDLRSMARDARDLLEQLAGIRPLLTRAVYAGSEGRRNAEEKAGPLADAVVSGPMTVELLRHILRLSVKKIL